MPLVLFAAAKFFRTALSLANRRALSQKLFESVTPQRWVVLCVLSSVCACSLVGKPSPYISQNDFSQVVCRASGDGSDRCLALDIRTPDAFFSKARELEISIDRQSGEKIGEALSTWRPDIICLAVDTRFQVADETRLPGRFCQCKHEGATTNAKCLEISTVSPLVDMDEYYYVGAKTSQAAQSVAPISHAQAAPQIFLNLSLELHQKYKVAQILRVSAIPSSNGQWIIKEVSCQWVGPTNRYSERVVMADSIVKNCLGTIPSAKTKGD
jgi:hypothetical protein